MSKPTVSGKKPQELPQPNGVALRLLAHLFDGLADDAREAMSAAANGSRRTRALPLLWTEASKLLCQASDAGAQFDFWPEGRTPREIESALRRLEESEAVSVKIRFLTLRPTHFMPLIWFSAVKGLADRFPEFFDPGSPERFMFPSPDLEELRELYWWEQHWKMQRRACELMAGLLRDYKGGQVVPPDKASFVVGSKQVMTDGQKRLWAALHGRALTAKELAAQSELDSSEDTVRQWVCGLKKAGYEISRRSRRGYFRPDAPPADSEPPKVSKVT